MAHVVLILALIGCAARGEVLDRLAVSVNKQVITENDILRELRIEAFLDQKSPDFSGPEKRKAADRLVDQFLIQQDAASSRTVLVSPEETAKLLENVKSSYGNDESYRAALVRSGITEQELQDHLAAGLRNLRFTENRFRPEVQLSDEELHEFYETQAAEWRQKNPAKVPSFEESRTQLEELLTEQRTTQALDRWLGMARTENQILYREEVFR